MTARSSAAGPDHLPCGLDDCILFSDVLQLPLQILDRPGVQDLSTPEREKLREGLRQAERFYRSYCQDCDLAGDEEQRRIGLGLFLMAEGLVEEGDHRPGDIFRDLRRLRKRAESREAKDATVEPEFLLEGARIRNRVTEIRETTTETAIEAVLKREEERLVSALSRILSLEENTRALLRALNGHLGSPSGRRRSGEEVEPSSEVAFLGSWERRLQVVADHLCPPAENSVTWVRGEQSALPASRARADTSSWNRSVRFVGEVGETPRVVVEAVLETDLARAVDDEPPFDLVVSLVDERRRNAVTGGYHHVVGFVRSGGWPDRVERMADRFGARSLEEEATTVTFVDLRSEALVLGGQGEIHDCIAFLFEPSSDQSFLREVREVAEGPLSEHGYVEVSRIREETSLPEAAVGWALDSLPWKGEMTHIEGVGEVYRRPLLEDN